MLSITGSVIQLQYFSCYLMSGIIGSNLFVNLLMLGAGEGVASIISGFLYSNYRDTTVVRGLAATTAIANILFYYVPAGPAQFICFLFTVAGIAGQFNGIFVLSEMRIPPQSIGGGLVIVSTVGTLCASLSAYLTQISDTFTMILPTALAITTICLTMCLGGA